MYADSLTVGFSNKSQVINFTMKKFTKISSFCLIIQFCSYHATTASYPFVGRCLQHSVVKDFNITRYSGIWYEIDKYFSFADYGLSCVSFNYRDRVYTKRNKETVEYMDFVKKGISKSLISRSQATTQTGKVIFSSAKKNLARMETTLQFRKGAGNIQIDEGKKEAYWILATDYDNYSVVWSCEHAGIMNFQNVVVLARERNPSMFTKGRAYGAMQRRGLSTKLLSSTDQEDCPEE